jgi:hypothetical protein
MVIINRLTCARQDTECEPKRDVWIEIELDARTLRQPSIYTVVDIT